MNSRRIPVFRIFHGRDRVRAAALVTLLFFGAILETIGVGLVMPFVALLADPGLSERSAPLRRLRDLFGASTPESFVLAFAGLLVGFHLVKAAALGALAAWQYRFLYSRMKTAAGALFEGWLRAPLTFHLARNSADLQRLVNNDVPVAFHWVVIPTFLLVADVLVALVIAALLLAVDAVATVAAVAVVAVAAALFYRFFRARTGRLGEAERESFGRMVREVNQGLGGVKETKVLGCESYFLRAFDRESEVFTRARRRVLTLNEMPRLVLETIAVAGLVGVVLVTIGREADPAAAVPIVGVFAAAAFRMLPAATRIVRSLNLIRHFRPSFDAVAAELDAASRLAADPPPPDGPPPRLEREFRFQDVRFTYPGRTTTVLDGVSARIAAGEVVALAGASGAGKTTLADVLLGLLTPDEGRIEVDGRDVSTTPGARRRLFGYIPQAIYLTDDTILRNVAFGLPDGEIDEPRVREALRSARLLEYVDGLADGLRTVVGERGVRLSGGQRQRIGIARALYRDPPVLVLDEATSALDGETEREIVETLVALGGERTIVMIAHRTSTLAAADRVLFLADGRIAAEGTFEDLLDSSPAFRRIVNHPSGSSRAALSEAPPA